jgi:glycosyltransferase involved in cell wall biosynthesis
MLDNDSRNRSFFVGDSKDVTSTMLDGLKYSNRKDIRRVIERQKPDCVYMHNIHPFLNRTVAVEAHRIGAVFVQHFHEPYVEDKTVYRGVQRYWLREFENIQERLLRFTDLAVVSSQDAESLFNKRYPGFDGKVARIPLLYEDLAGSRPFEKERRYVTFIGPLVPAKGPEILAKVVKLALNSVPELQFQVISRAPVKDRDLSGCTNLTIYLKERITDAEFGDRLQQSHVVIAPYKSVRQSSSVITSYMYGVPVIGSNVGGMTEVILPEKTGYLVNIDAKPEEWLDAICHVKRNFPSMSRNCREYFVTRHSEMNWRNYLEEVLHGGRS